MEYLVIAGWAAAMYMLAVWVRGFLKKELQLAREEENRRMFAQYMDHKYLADVSDEQLAEWRTSRWDD